MRSHAQKHFIRLEKKGLGSVVPPARRKARWGDKLAPESSDGSADSDQELSVTTRQAGSCSSMSTFDPHHIGTTAGSSARCTEGMRRIATGQLFLWLTSGSCCICNSATTLSLVSSASAEPLISLLVLLDTCVPIFVCHAGSGCNAEYHDCQPLSSCQERFGSLPSQGSSFTSPPPHSIISYAQVWGHYAQSILLGILSKHACCFVQSALLFNARSHYCVAFAGVSSPLQQQWSQHTCSRAALLHISPGVACKVKVSCTMTCNSAQLWAALPRTCCEIGTMGGFIAACGLECIQQVLASCAVRHEAGVCGVQGSHFGHAATDGNSTSQCRQRCPRHRRQCTVSCCCCPATAAATTAAVSPTGALSGCICLQQAVLFIRRAACFWLLAVAACCSHSDRFFFMCFCPTPRT